MSETRKIYCNTCQTETQHELKLAYSRHVRSSQITSFEFVEKAILATPLSFDGSEALYHYRLWICRGCETPTLQMACTAEGLVSKDGCEVDWTYSFYPKRSKQSLPHKHFIDLPANLYNIYYEAVESYNAGLITLSAIGLRAVLEGVCVDKGITDKVAGRQLESKIDKLGELNIVPANIAQSLHAFRFMGNDAAHRLEIPDVDELKLAFEVMDDLLNYLYSLDTKSRSLLEWIRSK